MTLKQRALADVIKILALGAILGTVITVAVDLFGLATVGATVSLLMLVYVSKVAYDIRLTQLEYQSEQSAKDAQ